MAEIILSFIAGVFAGIVLVFAICFRVIREVYRLSKIHKSFKGTPDPTEVEVQ